MMNMAMSKNQAERMMAYKYYVSGRVDDIPASKLRKDWARISMMRRKNRTVGVGITCTICLDDITEEDKRCIIKCNHVFHYKCLSKWRKRNNTCPIDRSVFDTITELN